MDTGFRDPWTPYCGYPPSVPWEKSGDGYRNVSLCSICWTPLHLPVKVQYSDRCNADDVMFMETVYTDPSIMGHLLADTTIIVYMLTLMCTNVFPFKPIPQCILDGS